MGKRISKTVNGVTTDYAYDGQNLIAELGASRVDYFFGPGIDEPVASKIGTNVNYYSVDALGSDSLVSDTNGAVQNQYVYDAWGIVRSQTAAVANSFGYTSREFAEVGLLYYRARYYNPNIGRFVSEDPPRNAGSLYYYVNNDPINMFDPLGLEGGPVSIIDNSIPIEDIFSKCPDYAGGSCIDPTSIKYSYSCNCDYDCAQHVWRATANAKVSLDIYIFGGDWKKFLRKHPALGCDRTVEDVESAKEHEFKWHIEKAKKSAEALARAINAHPFRTEWECTANCQVFRSSLAFQDLFETALIESQEYEKRCPRIKR